MSLYGSVYEKPHPLQLGIVSGHYGRLLYTVAEFGRLKVSVTTEGIRNLASPDVWLNFNNRSFIFRFFTAPIVTYVYVVKNLGKNKKQFFFKLNKLKYYLRFD